ncbi:MAG: ComF family protein [Agathobacter sp.]|nr:ComF family protein [Agathobacter sp.]
MKKKWQKIIHHIADAVGRVIFPPRCVLCDELLEPGQTWLHPQCEKDIFRVQEPVCMHCGRPVLAEGEEFCPDCKRKKNGSFSFRQGKALFVYQGRIKKAMYRFKYANRREYAAYFAVYADEKYGEWLRKIAPEAIVPVPMYGKKQRKRGYNQAKVFANALARQIGVPVRTDLVRRTRNTTPMKLLNDTERKNNLKNAFQTTQSIVKYKKILLVDDIYTTGSTADAVAECMRQAGVNDVFYMSICIGKGH